MNMKLFKSHLFRSLHSSLPTGISKNSNRFSAPIATPCRSRRQTERSRFTEFHWEFSTKQNTDKKGNNIFPPESLTSFNLLYRHNGINIIPPSKRRTTNYVNQSSSNGVFPATFLHHLLLRPFPE